MFSISKVISFRTSLINVLGARNFPIIDQVAGLKTIEERIGIPAKPKRPLVPFMRYYQKIRPTLIRENPSEKIASIARMAANQWKTIDSATKEKYTNDFRKEQDVFVKEIAKYQSSLTDEQREKVKQMKLLITEKKKTREKRRRARNLDKPKKPLAAFMVFLKEETLKAGASRDGDFKQFVVSVGEKWRQMSDAEKQKYKLIFKQSLEKHNKDIRQWEEKMIKLGNTDLVRRKALVETKPQTEKKTTKTATPAKQATRRQRRVLVKKEAELLKEDTEQTVPEIKVDQVVEEPAKPKPSSSIKKMFKFF